MDGKPYAIHSVIVKKAVPKEEAIQMAEDILKKKKFKMTELKNTYRFRNIAKTKFQEYRSKKINKNITLVFGELKPEFAHLQGSGIFDFFKQGYDYIKDKATDVVDKVKKVFSPRIDSYNNAATRMLQQYGDGTVTKITIYRKPLSDYLPFILNAVSLGKWKQLQKKYGIEKFFHLSLICVVKGEPLNVEKNEVVSISKGIPSGEGVESQEVPLEGKQFTLNQMMEKARQDAGDKVFFTYSALGANNCQNFLSYLLRGQGLYNEKAQEFIFQDISEMVEELPDYVKKFAQGTTDFAATFNKLTGQAKKGRGQSTSRYLPAGAQVTKRNVRKGIEVLVKPQLFAIPDDEVARDAVEKLLRDVKKKYNVFSVSREDPSLLQRIYGLLADNDYKEKAEQRLAYLGANYMIREDEPRREEYERAFEVAADRAFPREQEEKKYDMPDAPGVPEDAAAAESRRNRLTRRFLEAISIYRELRAAGVEAGFDESDPEVAKAIRLHGEVTSRFSSDAKKEAFIQQVNRISPGSVGSGMGDFLRFLKTKGLTKKPSEAQLKKLYKEFKGVSRLQGKGFWDDFKRGFNMVFEPAAKYILKPLLVTSGPQGLAAAAGLTALGYGKPDLTGEGFFDDIGNFFTKTIPSGFDKGVRAVDQGVKDSLKAVNHTFGNKQYMKKFEPPVEPYQFKPVGGGKNIMKKVKDALRKLGSALPNDNYHKREKELDKLLGGGNFDGILDTIKEWFNRNAFNLLRKINPIFAMLPEAQPRR